MVDEYGDQNQILSRNRQFPRSDLFINGDLNMSVRTHKTGEKEERKKVSGKKKRGVNRIVGYGVPFSPLLFLQERPTINLNNFSYGSHARKKNTLSSVHCPHWTIG